MPKKFCRMALAAKAVLTSPEKHLPSSVEMARRLLDVCRGDCASEECEKAMEYAGLIVR
ncbi:hypothetical protein [Paramagnetospirillum magnetotacticum]|uniref:hypothetical protein n=1 Tax=Paramagnetospirillum magnetotacticum TaxID=188 RepID=UPI0002D9372C|nr:hypothetical protein [Paramagnetospirillum magnetotacticum]